MWEKFRADLTDSTKSTSIRGTAVRLVLLLVEQVGSSPLTVSSISVRNSFEHICLVLIIRKANLLLPPPPLKYNLLAGKGLGGYTLNR